MPTSTKSSTKKTSGSRRRASDRIPIPAPRIDLEQLIDDKTSAGSEADETVSILVSKPSNTAFGAMLDKPEHWSAFPDGIPFYGEAGGTFVTLGGELSLVTPERSIAAFKSFFATLNDRLLQVFVYFLSHEIENESGRKTTYHVNDILDWLGYSRHQSRDHKPELKREIADSIAQLNEIWVNVRDKVRLKNGKTKWIVLQSRLVEVDFETHYDTDPETFTTAEDGSGSKIRAAGTAYSFNIALGTAMRDYAKLGTFIRPIAAVIVKYDLSREHLRVAQRIAMRVLIQEKRSWTVRDLLKEALLDVPKIHPQRFVDLVEKALDRLVQDGVIGGWIYSNNVDLPQRKWLEVWLSWEIVFPSQTPRFVEPYPKETAKEESRTLSLPFQNGT